jgi:tetratricopeptide (TPR) repeat protein
LKYFLSPIIVREIALWSKNTGETPVVFESLAKACGEIGPAFYPHDTGKANELSNLFSTWLSSDDFAHLLSAAHTKSSSISLELARRSVVQLSNSESFLIGIPIDDALSAFSALVRADFRVKDSRASVRIDELYIWQGFSRAFDLHDVTMLLLATCSSKNVLASFDKLLSIKASPQDLIILTETEFGLKGNPAFLSALRMYALSNFEAAETGFAKCLESDPASPAYTLALALALIIKYEPAESDFARASDLVSRCSALESSVVQEAIKFLIAKRQGVAAEFLKEIDPVSFFLESYVLLLERRYEDLESVAQKHFQSFPDDILALLTLSISDIMQVQDDYYDDPPLPGSERLKHEERIQKADERFARAENLAKEQDLNGLLVIATLGRSLLSLMSRNFNECIKLCDQVLLAVPGCPEAKLNKSIANIALGNLPAALISLQGTSQHYAIICSRLAAEAYFHACAFDDALKIWNLIVDQEPERLWRLRLLCRMLESYRLLQDSKNGQRCVDILLKEFQSEPETILALAYELWQLGKSDEAVGSLQRAKTFAAPNLRKWISWELGRVLFDIGKTLAATDEYLNVSNEQIESVQAREFAVALYKTDLKPAAYKWAKLLRELRQEVIPGITEIETDYLASEGQLKEAKDLLIALSQKRPLSVMNLIATARICATLGEHQEAKEILSKIRSLNLSDEMKEIAERFEADVEIVMELKQKESK